MAKRFTDTDKYKKGFIRGLKAPYKLLWDYLYHDCNHAGIWIKDFDIAQIYIGIDAPVSEQDALDIFNKDETRIISFDNDGKWFLPGFIDFQYGSLNEKNRAHKSVISMLEKYGLFKIYREINKPLTSPLEGYKDKDKDKDKEIKKEKGECKGEKTEPDSMPENEPDRDRSKSFPSSVETIVKAYPRQSHHCESLKAVAATIDRLFDSGKFVSYETVEAFLLDRVKEYAKAIKSWPPDEQERYIPMCSRWMEAGQYYDDPGTWKRTQKQGKHNATDKTSNNFRNSGTDYSSMPQRPSGDF